MLGELRQAGDRWQLRFTRRLVHAPDKVWRALTEPEHLATWFPSTIDGDRAAGAALRFRFPESAATDPIAGEMLAYDPPRLMEFRWGGDILRFELEPDGTGTKLTLTDTLDELGKAARDAAGWHECLDILGTSLDDTGQRTLGNRWPELNAEYTQAFPPEASTVGPPKDWEPERA